MFLKEQDLVGNFNYLLIYLSSYSFMYLVILWICTGKHICIISFTGKCHHLDCGSKNYSNNGAKIAKKTYYVVFTVISKRKYN